MVDRYQVLVKCCRTSLNIARQVLACCSRKHALNFDKGWHDGTCYGEPIDGSLEALKQLSNKWNIIIFTAKARPDRPLVNGKTGIELVEEWLEKHDVLQYVDDITWEKPRAEYYIDDKGIKFENNWIEILQEVL